MGGEPGSRLQAVLARIIRDDLKVPAVDTGDFGSANETEFISDPAERVRTGDPVFLQEIFEVC